MNIMSVEPPSQPLASQQQPQMQQEQHQQQQPQQTLHQQQQQRQSFAPPPQQGQNATPYAQYPAAYGQPFQPYNAPQAGQQPVGGLPAGAQVIAPPLPIETKKRAMAKCAMHAAVVVFGIIVLGLSVALHLNFHYGTVGSLVLFSIPIPAIAMLWSIAELITRAVRKFQDGLHPGAHVGLCLLLWITLSIMGGSYATYSAISRGSNFYCDSRYNPDTGYYEDYDCADPFVGLRAAFIALTAFVWFMWLLEFVLFIMACIDTSRRNAAQRQPVVVIPAPSMPYWAPPMQGWSQLPPDSSNGAPNQQQQRQSFAPTHPAVGHGTTHPGQDIPLQQRTRSPVNAQTEEEVRNEKGKGPMRAPEQPAHAGGVAEYYAPGSAH